MRRYNVFLSIHKGLRLMMYDVSKNLQHTDFTEANNYPDSLKKLFHTLDVFDAHAGHEDNFIFNLLTPFAPELLAEMEAEHVTDHKLSHELRTLISDYRSTDDMDKKYVVGTSICRAFNEFISFNLSHLNKEETVVNDVLWKNYTDMDIIMANRQLVSSLSVEQAQMSAIWMIRSNNNQELIGWLKGLKGNIPEEMMQMLMESAEKELTIERFETISNAINKMD